ncbi:MAG: LysM peptidoglycan-binding domain-containing protein [Myxococcaceae bacterium]|nr:LysM peptidoglycan-binding domain-containing protein [Myxococcaceae bacterium]
MASTHLIQRGDTLWALARKYGTTIEKFAKVNGISNPNLIIAGRRLKIPGRGGDSFETGNTGNTHNNGGGNAGANLNGYNRSIGNRLVNASRQVAAEMPGSGWCAKGVSTAVSRVLGFYPGGNGNTIDDNLARSPKFKEVHMSLAEALKIPGLILSWDRTSSAAGQKYGHTAITWGDGHTSSSDYVEGNTTNNGRSGLRIFMPV